MIFTAIIGFIAYHLLNREKCTQETETEIEHPYVEVTPPQEMENRSSQGCGCQS